MYSFVQSILYSKNGYLLFISLSTVEFSITQNLWKSAFVVPKKRVKNFVVTMHSRTLLENIYRRFGCKNDNNDNVYVI